MNKTIIININSIVFHIEEDAYERLRNYMIDIKKHFGQSEDSHEILQDIENRIAEMFTEKIQVGSKEVLNAADVDAVIAQMGKVSDFESDEQDDYPSYGGSEKGSGFKTGKKLMRDPDDKIFGGVCSGLGHFFGIESKWVRLLFALFFIAGGSSLLVYIILWIVMPLALTRADRMEMRGEAPNIQNFKRSFEDEMSGAKDSFSRTVDRTGEGIFSLLKIIVKVLGVLFVFVIGLVLIGLVIAFVFFSLGIYNITPDGINAAPPFNMMEPSNARIASIAALLAIFIPFMGLFYLLIRLLFDKKPMNNYLTATLGILWLISIVGIIYYSTDVAKDFVESSTIVEERPLAVQPVYYLRQNDVRVIKVGENSRRGIRVNGDKLSSFLRKNIRIRVERTDSSQRPFIRYEYSAKGSSYKLATERAAKIDYQIRQDSAQLFFDSHFRLQDNEIYRDQEVNITLYLPVGTKVIISDELEDKLRDVSFYDCRDRYNSDERVRDVEFSVTSLGLKCGIPLSESTSENADKNDVSISADTTLVIRRDTVIRVTKDGVTIKTGK